MSLRAVLLFPDPALAVPALPVERFDDALRALADDLLQTMSAAGGIGITASHVGVRLRVVVLQLTPGEPARTYVNPVIDWVSPERIRHAEGSVSMPGVTEQVERAARVRVRYQDLDGAVHLEDADGLLAICHQHEIDQLDGIFWLQRLSGLKRDRVIKRYRKLAG